MNLGGIGVGVDRILSNDVTWLEQKTTNLYLSSKW